MTLFSDHKDGARTINKSRIKLRMGIERAEVQWSNLIFDSKSLNHQLFDTWLKKVLSDSEVSKMLSMIGMKKALNLLK